jgi:hypothetical protein
MACLSTKNERIVDEAECVGEDVKLDFYPACA